MSFIALALLIAVGTGAAKASQFYNHNYNLTVSAYLRDQDRTWIAQRKLGQSPHWNPPELALQLDPPGLKPIPPAPYRRIIAARECDSNAADIRAGWVTLWARAHIKLQPL